MTWGNNRQKHLAKEPAKKRRAKGDSCCHFPYNAWLPDALKNPPEDARCKQNGPNREDQLLKVFNRGPFGSQILQHYRFHPGLTLWDCGRFMV